MRIRVVGLMAGALVATLLVPGLSGPDPAGAASAASTSVVRGTAFPDPQTAQLSLTGCATLNGVAPETPRPTVGTGPGAAPSGTRSLGYDLAGGNAVGALFPRSSMAETTTADLQVYAEAGARGVAYASFQEPADAGTQRMWIGRADLVASAGGWQRVGATGLGYAWSKHDLQTGAELLPALRTATVADFLAGHGGDGGGFYTIGFGCDGSPFSLDTFRVGTAGSMHTYDLEGLATTTSIRGTGSVLTGGSARLTGSVRDQGGARVPGATLLLEQRPASGGAWEPVDRDPGDGYDPVVLDAAGADPAVEVTPERTTSYRFRFVDRPLAEGSASAPFTVTVTPTLTARLGPDRVVAGVLSPAERGASVSLWRDGRAGTSALARAQVDAEGRYEIPVPAEVGGDLVVRYAGSAGLQPATSEPVRVPELLRSAPTPTPTPTTPTATPTPAQQDQAPAQGGREDPPVEQKPVTQPSQQSTPEPTRQPDPASESTPAQPEQRPEQQPADQPEDQSTGTAGS